jgi:hypothetical protein
MAARRLIGAIMAAMLLVGCSSGTVPVANLAPAGQEWFGTAFDTTTFALTGTASSFPAGSSVAVVAHLSKKVPEGQAIAIMVDGYAYGSGKGGPGGSDVYGIVIAPGGFAGMPGPAHIVTFADVGGNVLATGSVTVK